MVGKSLPANRMARNNAISALLCLSVLALSLSIALAECESLKER